LPLTTREAALEQLAPILPILRDAILGGWNEYREQPVELQLKYTPRTRANAVRDLILDRVRVGVDGMPGVKIVKARGLDLLSLLGDTLQLLIRFKKLDRNKLASSYPTMQAQLFDLQLPLEGVPTATRLSAGYQLTKDQGDIAGIFVTCQVGAHLAWDIDVLQETSTPVVELPLSPAIAATLSLPVSIKVDQKKTKESKE